MDKIHLLCFPALMVIPLSSDLMTMKIPNWVPAGLIVAYVAISLSLQLSWADIGLNLSCGAVALIISTGLFARGWIGGGDAKLASATAVWIGWGSLFDYGILVSLLGGLLTLAVLAYRTMPLPPALATQDWIARLHDRRSGIPYGIALAIAGLMQYPHTQIWSAAV